MRTLIKLPAFRIGILFASLLLQSACTSVDFNYPKTPSSQLSPQEVSGTRLNQYYSGLNKGEPGESGFYLLNDGIESIAARLLLADRAEKSIDAQYYLISNDRIGLIFIGALLDAADRGVRVRLLLDDIQTQGYDLGLSALNEHPNFEIRIFNPFGSRGARALNFFDFSRVNRRMHNKSFTADNVATIIGGRNIADEYFNAREDVNFGDLDVYGVGPVAQDVSDMYDLYWNHHSSLPVPAFAKTPENTDAVLSELRGKIEAAKNTFNNTQYQTAFRQNLDELTSHDQNKLTWAPYKLVYDSPDKSIRSKSKNADSIVSSLRESLLSAQQQVLIISPYFVPMRSGAEFLIELEKQGIDVSVVTNSLAANNHAVVHSGYAPARKPLLQAGVTLYEVKANAKLSGVDRGGQGSALATLHTKAFLIDKDAFFLGSFNFDPRSANINTELGVIIESPEIGEGVYSGAQTSIKNNAFAIELSDKGDLVWVDNAGGYPVTYSTEPDTSWWSRFKVGFMQILPIKNQL